MPKAKDLTGDLGRLRGRNLDVSQANPLRPLETRPAADPLAFLFWAALVAFAIAQGIFLVWLSAL